MGSGRRIVVGALVAVLAAMVLPLDARSAELPDTVIDGCIDSVPEAGATDPTPICFTLYQPAAATAEHPVPIVFHSHGWGGARERGRGAFGDWMDAGFGVLSFDQRGFGDSGGYAHIEDPDFEGQDVIRLIDHVAGLDWVAKDGPGDPVLGAIGGSYGGGYQFVGAFAEVRDRGATRFDAIAPEITWWDLRQSLAPQGVVRTLWVLLLYVAGLPSDAHLPVVTASLLQGVVTGQLPPQLSAYLENNGPAWHVAAGRQLDIPVLFGQGITDNLFPLDQGLQNFQQALTPAARARSIFVGYNGGHVLPSIIPAALSRGADPCSAELMDGDGGFGSLSRRFLTEELLGRSTGLGGRGEYHLATQDGQCVTVDSVTADTPVPIADVLTTVGVGLPLSYKVADGPIVVAGTPTIDASVTSLAVDGRAFLGLSVGTNPLGAKVVGNNLLPLHEPVPVVGEHRTIPLPSVAVDVPAGQSLYVTVSALSDMSIGHGSRLPGVVTLDDVVVNLPVVEPPAPPVVEATPESTTTTTTAAAETAVEAATARPRAAATTSTTFETRTSSTNVTRGPGPQGAPAPEAPEASASPPTQPASDDGGDGDDDVPIGAGIALAGVFAVVAAMGLWARFGFRRLG